MLLLVVKMHKYYENEKYNLLKLLNKSSQKNNDGAWLWNAICDCGNEVLVLPYAVRSGHTKSCGCHNKSQLVINHTTHGKRFTKEYKTWCGMKARCCNPRDKSFPNYGGRGIEVCSEWKEDFSEFYKDMGNCPFGFSIERKNNNLGYSPDNCIWADRKVQSRNRRSSVFVYIGKEKMVLRDAEVNLGIYKGSIYQHANGFNRSHQQACDHFSMKKNIKIINECRYIIRKIA